MFRPSDWYQGEHFRLIRDSLWGRVNTLSLKHPSMVVDKYGDARHRSRGGPWNFNWT
jgi:hypothetical protein